MGITAYDVRVIADSLLLARTLYGEPRRDTIPNQLADPIHADTLTVLPDWLHVKRYIEHHPTFIADDQRRVWWRNSDRSTTDRRRLVREFAAAVCGKADPGFTLLTPRLLRNNGEVAQRVLENFDGVITILNDAERRPSEKRTRLVSLLGKNK